MSRENLLLIDHSDGACQLSEKPHLFLCLEAGEEEHREEREYNRVLLVKIPA